MADDQPKVEGGLLSHPLPIKTRGDVNRARVLPQVRETGTRPAASAPAPAAKPVMRDTSLDAAKGGFDYVSKRRRLQREISGRR